MAPPSADQYQRKQDAATVTIANGVALSGALALYGSWLCGLVTPAAWTAADITFLVSYDNGTTYVPLYSASAEVKIATAIIATAESRYFYLDPNIFHGATHVKVQSGVNGTTVNQGAARIITLARTFRLS